MLAFPTSRPGKAIIRSLGFVVCFLTFLELSSFHRAPTYTRLQYSEDAPLVKQVIDEGSGHGGRWYIPSSWLEDEELYFNPNETWLLEQPLTALDAARLSMELAVRRQKFIRNTQIPLIVHQTWRSMRTNTWSKLLQDSVQKWLDFAQGRSGPEGMPEMAYIMWDDEGVEDLLSIYEYSQHPNFCDVPYTVETSDIFRVAVLRWFGGVYGDIDTKPLQHPYLWAHDTDLEEWIDPKTSASHGLRDASFKPYTLPDRIHFNVSDGGTETRTYIATNLYREYLERIKPMKNSVAAMVGIEGDNPPDTDDYWRAGYYFPQQITNWAMAMAPHHPLAARYLNQVSLDIEQKFTRLKDISPLELTGPPAFTRTIKDLAESENSSLKWEAISGLDDPPGGRGKIVAGDTIVLPMTGFSPGRLDLWPHRWMGSMPTDHPEARLYHEFAGSWRHKDLKSEMVKFCRTFLGMCKGPA